MKQVLPLGMLVAGLLITAPAGIGQELSQEEKDAGFVSMFNGKDLTGWEYLGKGASPFQFQDGTIHYKGGNGWLCYTVKEYPDFELRCDFKLIKKGGDGGIFFRATKDAAGGASWPSQRYELQVKDYAEQARLWGVPYKLDKDRVAKVRKKLGEWETYRLVVQGNKVEVVLNGELVNTADTAKSLKQGYLGLQAEGGEQAFRNLRIRALSAARAEPAAGASALEADPKGWEELFNGKDLTGWKRVPLAPDVKLNAKDPWSVDARNKLLLCDGVGVKEMLLHDGERADGIFHLEWRFHKVAGKADYNSGAYVRSANDGKVWVQAQIAHLDKPPFVGDLFADLLIDGQIKRVVIEGRGTKRVRPPGEWNTYEITCKGKTLAVWLNGAVVTTWTDCPLAKGYVGVQAEFYFIEFRNLKWKASK